MNYYFEITLIIIWAIGAIVTFFRLEFKKDYYHETDKLLDVTLDLMKKINDLVMKRYFDFCDQLYTLNINIESDKSIIYTITLTIKYDKHGNFINISYIEFINQKCKSFLKIDNQSNIKEKANYFSYKDILKLINIVESINERKILGYKLGEIASNVLNVHIQY